MLDTVPYNSNVEDCAEMNFSKKKKARKFKKFSFRLQQVGFGKIRSTIESEKELWFGLYEN